MNRTAAHCGILLMIALTVGCRSASERGHGHTEAPAEAAKGPHGGRLLREDGFGVEVTIFEDGVPPELRAYAYEGDRPIEPNDVKLTITLRRFGGRVDTIEFAKRDDFLLGDTTVVEPHSFDVEVAAEHDGRTRRWTYASYEGRTELSPTAIARSGVEIETIGPATIRTVLHVSGRIEPNGDRLAHVAPRYAGIVKDVRARLGDVVASGQVLAIIQNNESLQPYDLKAPIAGTIVTKDVLPGELAREDDVLFTITDLSTVWVQLEVPSHEADRVRAGQQVTVARARDATPGSGTIVYVSPIGIADTQTRLARVEIVNSKAEWAPGLYVTGEIIVDETTVPVAVKSKALQTFRDWDVVFLNEGTVFQAMPFELGRRDAEWVEVTAGVTAGQRYATENSFIVKADIQKSGASHDH